MNDHRPRSGNNDAIVMTPLATFSGLRRFPLIALSHNSLFPSLVIGPQAVTIRVLRRHVLAYDDLMPVRLSRRLGHRLTFAPRQGWRDFTASFASREEAAKALAALVDFGAPVDGDSLALIA
ncbi:hypothetical protein OCUBac02_41050 [Bosea sp. ANAM02]|nr:hypothetical protein OCUBac02_41050 [Bosea sp. ANAM02]